MKISLRRSKQQGTEDVRWLAPTRIRQPRRRYRLIGLLALLVLVASGGVITFVVMGGGQQTARTAAETPGRIASAPPEPSRQQDMPPDMRPDTPATAPLSPIGPVPAPRVAEPGPAPAQTPPTPPPPPPEQAPEASAPPVAAAPPVADAGSDPDANAGALDSSIAGAFPAPSAEATDDPEAPNFAVYLNEAAPDEAGVRALLVEAQRKYASALEGGRLSYRRVRVNDGYAWRLRLSGLTRARAQETCEALASLGAACEVGPR